MEPEINDYFTKRLMDYELVKRCHNDTSFTVTERGKCLINHICNTPLPEWNIKDTNANVDRYAIARRLASANNLQGYANQDAASCPGGAGTINCGVKM